MSCLPFEIELAEKELFHAAAVLRDKICEYKESQKQKKSVPYLNMLEHLLLQLSKSKSIYSSLI